MFLNIFKSKVKNKPEERILYAITDGIHIGSAIVFINPKNGPINNKYRAMVIGGKNMVGGMDIIEISELDVANGLKAGVLDKIKKIPNELYALCCNEYYEREKINTMKKEIKTEKSENEFID